VHRGEAAKVMACSSCATTSTVAEAPNAAVAANRSAVAAAAASSHCSGVRRWNQRPWYMKKAISAATDTAQNSPTAAFP
jgi:hypothetical protein